jgi:hypothetical protein
MKVLGQPASPRSRGAMLYFDLLWLGAVYGGVDALILSVFPVVASFRIGRGLGWTSDWRGRVGTAALGMMASMLVTSTYHLGYAEFRGPSLGKALLGNAIMSASQIATASPIAATSSHIAMHITAVLHAPETAVQLPPHQVHR